MYVELHVLAETGEYYYAGQYMFYAYFEAVFF